MGNLSCYDAACVARLQTKLRMDFRGIAEGTPRDCLARNLSSGFEAMLVAETLKADPDALGRLMADHTQVTCKRTTVCTLVERQLVVCQRLVPVLRKVGLQIDWRPLLPRITIPCLNLRGLRNGVFHPEGTAVVSKLVPRCDQVRIHTALWEDAAVQYKP